MITRVFAALLVAAPALALTATPARAQDAVHFASDIHVPSNGSVRDAVCFFCSVEAEGQINGDVVVFFGHTHIAGQAHRDVVTFFGGVDVDDEASVGRDLVDFFGSVQLGNNASVGHDMVAFFGRTHVAQTASVANSTVFLPGLFLDVPLILFVIVGVVLAREYRAWRWRRYYASYPYPYPHQPPPPPSPPQV